MVELATAQRITPIDFFCQQRLGLTLTLSKRLILWKDKVFILRLKCGWRSTEFALQSSSFQLCNMLFLGQFKT